jgi:glutathione S-transferase
MKLFYSPGACSLSPHIVLRETGIPFTLEKVDLAKSKWSGGDYSKINPKGYVPALELDNGEVLTEGLAISTYLAEKKPETNLLPSAGTLERARCFEWMTFVATELHKGLSLLWVSGTPDSVKTQAKERVGKRIDFVETQLQGKDWLCGKQFTIADAYFFTVMTWTDDLGYDFKNWPNVTAFMDRMKKRPKVQETLKEEGLA